MTNRKNRKTFSPARNNCRSLIVIDATPIRKRAKRDYEQALRELEKARRQLDEFQKEDKPRFLKWLNSHFGALLTELRETSQKLETKRQLLFEVESEVFFSNTSYGRAYQRVLHRKEQPDTGPVNSSGNRDAGSGRDPFEEEFARADGTGFQDPLEGEINDFFDALEDGFADTFGIPRNKTRRRIGNRHSAPASSRIKELYRTLVRRLHPDTQNEMTSQKLEWWHQAQQAYQAGDTEQLEVILTLCEIEEHGTTSQTSVSLLQRIVRQFKHSLRSLKTQLMECKRDLAWNFSQRTDLKTFAVRTQRALADDLLVLKAELESIEMQFREWTEQANRRTHRKHSRRQFPNQAEFF